MVIGICGCQPDDNQITVATSWPVELRTLIEADLKRAGVGSVRWISLAPTDNIGLIAGRRAPPDLILGGPLASYEALALRGLLPPDREGSVFWGEARVWGSLQASDRGGRVVRDGGLIDGDPRRDPWALAGAKEVLASATWAEGYAQLVRSAPRSISRDPMEHEPGRLDRQGVGILNKRPQTQRVLEVLRQSKATGRYRPPALNPEADSLLADLLGATQISASDELGFARKVLKEAGWPVQATLWMTEPPPWPPASVSKLLERESKGMLLLETLATQLTPEPELRAWLVRSWLSPAQVIDDRLLGELAGALGGRLAREPRFRAWLRAEWTAWARQRYRRVVRQLRAAASVSAATS